MKSKLIDKLIREYDRDKWIMRWNLMTLLDEIVLETEDEYGKVCLIIKYERKDTNDKTK